MTELRAAFWPHLLPIARDWAERLGRPDAWPDDFEDWLEQCHGAGQTRPTPLMLRYGPGDWNALHRDLYGDLVFPLQVVIGLDEPGVDYTGGEFVVVEQPHAGPVPGDHRGDRPGPGPGVHHPRPARPHRPGAGRPPRCATASACCAPAGAARSASSSTTPHDWRLLGPDGLYNSPAPGTLGGHRRTRIYGRLDCRAARAALARGGQYRVQRVFFADEATAAATGYRPCAVCLPDEHARWKALPGARPRRGDSTRSGPG